jgi:cell shape-determining protein MreD
MKPRVYVLLFLLIIPVQASLFGPVSVFGVKPDLPLALLYIIGLLTGPIEGALAGICLGLLLGVGSAGLLGLDGIAMGLFGLGAGFLGQRMFDVASPANFIFLFVLCCLEGAAVLVFIAAIYGSGPLLEALFGRMLPQALYTGILGTLMLSYIKSGNITALLLRRSLQKE